MLTLNPSPSKASLLSPQLQPLHPLNGVLVGSTGDNRYEAASKIISTIIRDFMDPREGIMVLPPLCELLGKVFGVGTDKFVRDRHSKYHRLSGLSNQSLFLHSFRD